MQLESTLIRSELPLPQDSFSFKPVVQDAIDFYKGIFEVGALIDTDPKRASAKLFLAVTKRGFFFVRFTMQGYAVSAHKVPAKDKLEIRRLNPTELKLLEGKAHEQRVDAALGDAIGTCGVAIVVIVVGAGTGPVNVLFIAEGVVLAAQCGIAVEKYIAARNDRASMFSSGAGEIVSFAVDVGALVVGGTKAAKAIMSPSTRMSGLLLHIPSVMLKSGNLITTAGEWLSADSLREKLRKTVTETQRLPMVFDPFAGFGQSGSFGPIPYDPFRSLR